MVVHLSLSHKGGTGRSVASANVAFHAARQGEHVCLVDVDLASPTLGAVLGIPGLEAGVAAPSRHGSPSSLGDLLDHPDQASSIDQALVSAWKSPDLMQYASGPVGDLYLLPGSSWRGDEAYHRLTEPLAHALGMLNDRFDRVVVDVRSGVSTVVQAFLEPPLSQEVDVWLVFFRWTPQHVTGLDALLRGLQDKVNVLRTVRTAYVEPDQVAERERRDWVKKCYAALDQRYQAIDPRHQQLLATIPLEPLLQWQEMVVTPDYLDLGLANPETFEAFASLTTELGALTP